MPKVGDIVIHSLQGHTHNAIVLGLNEGQVNHLGANGEPLLHLTFIAPERESEKAKTKIGYIPETFIEYDVVHHSHAFSEQYRKDNGLSSPAQIAAARGQGEWSLPKPAESADDKKLQTFLLGNFKSETGNETPVDCAIRLLSKVKSKK